MNAWRNLSLSTQILAALIAGLLVGLLFNFLAPSLPFLTTINTQVFGTIGNLFMSALKLLVVPLVFVSLVVGTTSLSDPAKLGRLGVGTMLFYLATTAFAIVLALVGAKIVNPGLGVNMAMPSGYEAPQAPPVSEVLVGIIPSNPVAALAEGNMLQIIFFAILLGLAIMLSGKPGERIKAAFEDWNHVVMQIVNIVMVFAPIGVFALMAGVVAKLGFESLAPLLKYFMTVLVVLLIHLFVSYPLLLRLFSGLNPFTFIKKMRPAMLFAFSTSSSNATIPVNLRTAREALGVPNQISSFTIPLGATINMDGTAIMQGVAVIFISQVYGIDLTLAQLGTVVIMAVLASVGTAGVPGVGLVMLATVLTQVGVPVEGIAMIIGIDRLLDMTRTAVNITGDAAVTAIMAKREGVLDEAMYNDPNAQVELDADELGKEHEAPRTEAQV
ncbi:sodium:dicarboxylate symporter [Deinococcus proteolyticus MRP]|uniref:Sodium:dicarboxylate symporter n=1 Tax=Deinococcus proteolyticus (strain ATCC 35074 / DSM 20540 / JCM 6276 / NBRC 101906 / NCIMB 13154 / VKM Ac-1939 / CCM 2703 / MRP) TaxID=693977 RepID=F0RN29_DEIPM|nr:MULTISPECIES: dicarboxylate/amino acid:cation symporter [Deinococcus]ADY26171.1 sodium:dicarboxylate symporter [Deinococcus proteolyticus MRP]MCY1702291.1 dicarboxylate/amino acid:cation symporter [Deinococcus sp. SL84]